jgi:predicted acyl esterase
VEPQYETELIKNLLIPMSDGVTLAADLYRPRAEERFPALVSFTCYHKDGWYGMAYGELMRAMAQVGYVVVAVDVRGTGNAEGSTQFVRPSEAGRDYYDVIEWCAEQDWCEGKVGVWGKSFGGGASLVTASENPPHLGAAVVFHTGGSRWMDGSWVVMGRPRFLESVAQFGPRMANWNSMPPGYRDPEGRWLSVWREHLENNVPWLVSALDMYQSGEDDFEPWDSRLARIQTPTYIWSGWRDIFPKEMTETYGALTAPKKLTVGPWMHVLPDAGHAGCIDYLHELQRWFDYWLKEKDTGIMDEPPVSVWVQEADTWFHADEFPPPEVKERAFYLGPEGTLVHEKPSAASGSDSFTYDATAGAYSDVRGPKGLKEDQKPDEIKGLTYTTPPLEEDMEICGPPELTLQYETTVPDTFFAVKLCDVWPDGKATIITEGWLDVTTVKTYDSAWGTASDDGPTANLRIMPSAYLLRAGHALRLTILGSNFPRLLPSIGSGEITVKWGEKPFSMLKVPVRPPQEDVRNPSFLTPREIPHAAPKAPVWVIEQSPTAKTVTVRIGMHEQMAIDGGEGPATVTYTHDCSGTVGQEQPSSPTARGESWGCRESENEKIEVKTVSVYRTTGFDMIITVTMNGAPYWRKHWSRDWREDGAK